MTHHPRLPRLPRFPRFLPAFLGSVLLGACAALGGCGLGGAAGGLGGGGGGGGGGGTPAATMSAQERVYADRVLELVNQERASRSLPLLTWSEAAATAAYGHAVDMDVRDYFDHDSPDGSSPGDRLAAAGAGGRGWGENIARGQGSPEAVMAAWMNSPGHRSNILHTSFRALGVGVHIATDGPWWVQNFLAP